MDQFSTQDMLALIRSPAGQALLETLRQQDPATLEQAKHMAQSGNYCGVQNALASMLQDPQIMQLLQQFGGGKSG